MTNRQALSRLDSSSFHPLFRSTVGFDRLMQLMDAQLKGPANSGSYPPYDIEKCGENSYRIAMAIAGFGRDDITIEQEGNTLRIAGRKSTQDNSDDETTYLHRGIATRDFQQTFELADYIDVEAADIDNGMLIIHLARTIPEQLKPRKIKLGSNAKKLLKRDAA